MPQMNLMLMLPSEHGNAMLHPWLKPSWYALLLTLSHLEQMNLEQERTAACRSWLFEWEGHYDSRLATYDTK